MLGVVLLMLSAHAQAERVHGPQVRPAVLPRLSAPVTLLPLAQASAGHAREMPMRRGTPAVVVERSAQPVPRSGAEPRAARGVPAPLQSFEGMSDDGAVPPDTVGDVGPNHYLQMVNSGPNGANFAIYNKSGVKLAGPTALGQLWLSAGVTNACALFGYGDPVVVYDQLANRWLLSQFAFESSIGPPWYLAMAVSVSSDPLGAYYVYCFEENEYFPDYPKYGVWPDAYYMTSNDDFGLVGAWAFERDKMLLGQAARVLKFEVDGNLLAPADCDGSAPPANAPNYMYTMMDDTFWPSQGYPGPDRYEIWECHVDWATTNNSSMTQAAALPCAAFNYTVAGYFVLTAITQRATLQKVDAVSEWPMWRAQYRNFGTYQTLVGNFTVDADGADHAGIRWFELRRTVTNNWTIYQENTFVPDANNRWMGSIAMNAGGDMALGYSVSGSNLFPGIRYTGRVAADALGTLAAETNIWTGFASQTSSARWGDYSAMSVDPTDDATFWYTQEYIGSNGTWRTRISTLAVVPEPQWSVVALMLAPLVRRRTSQA